MATEIKWIIEWMQTTPPSADPSECVITAGWRCNGVDGEYTGTVYGTCSFPGPGDPYTPYADLTQDQVLGWCWANGVDKDATQAAVEQQIQNAINPPLIQPPLPWLPPAPTPATA